ncbi:putative fungal specific transcription protein [Fonsecaea pedrosoi]|nr:putative fungal specific transcription protein [Fonsecaea pedrosoi]
MPVAKEAVPKSTLACDYCRLKKDKHRVEIVRKIQRKPREAKEVQRLLQDRLEKAEDLLRQAGIVVPATQPSSSSSTEAQSGSTWTANVFSEPRTLDAEYERSQLPGSETCMGTDRPSGVGSISTQTQTQTRNQFASNLASPFQHSQIPFGNSTSDDRGTRDATLTPHGHIAVASSYTNTYQPSATPPDTRQGNPTLRPLEFQGTPSSTEALQVHGATTSVHDGNEPASPVEELHGPGSYLSICSNPAAEWVSKQIGVSGFTDSAASLTSTVYRDLKMQTSMQRGRVPEPDLACARDYAAAYFDHAFESAFDIVDRASFEARLTAQILGSASGDDPAWYALRNVVYAFGCRASTYRETVPESWAEAQRKSWQYFENALSVHTELVYFRSNLSAVQALLAMSLFVEGMGNPKLEYMLISTTVRLAQSKGLHLQPPATTKLSAAEIALRSRLFWTMYFYEKHIAYRACRPSMINDDHIDCQFPEPVDGQASIKTEFFHHVIRHAQISSSIIDQLTAAKARRRKPSKTIETVNEIHQRLKSWYDTVPATLRFRRSQPVLASPDLQMSHITYLHLAYHGSLAAIHSVFAYPWELTRLEAGSDVDLNPQIDASTQILAEAARNIILTTKYLHLSAAAPAWELFLYPIVGMINLFVYILKYPTRSSVPSDLGLLQMAAGYFGYLDYATTSTKRFPFTKDIVKLAQNATERAQGSHRGGSEVLPALTAGLETNGNDGMDLCSWDEEFGDFDVNEIGLENLVCFLPSLTQVSSMAMDTLPDGSIDFSISK